MQFGAASRDGYDVDWPITYDDVKPYYDKVDVLLGCSGTKEGLEQVPDGIFQRPSKLNCVEVAFQRAIAKMGRRYIPGRAGVTTDGVLNNKYRTKCLGRGRCGRGCDINASLPFADRAHLSRARHREPHHPALLGRLRGVPRRGHRQGGRACASSTPTPAR